MTNPDDLTPPRARPDCDICGRPFSTHNMGSGFPVCPVAATLYRPKALTPPAMSEAEAVEANGTDAILGCEACGREVHAKTNQIACPNCGAALWEDEDCADMLRAIGLRISANIGFSPSLICRDIFAAADRLKILASAHAPEPLKPKDGDSEIERLRAEVERLRGANDKLAAYLYEACGGFPVSEEAFAAVAADLPVIAAEMKRPFVGRTLAAFRAEIEDGLAALKGGE